MQDYFKGIENLDDGKRLYHELLKENHPDLGGSEELCKEIVNQFERFLSRILQTAWNEAGDEKTGDNDIRIFADILKKIKDFNMVIEIVGYWIYARNGSYDYKDQLKEMGFFFSGKHKAWIYNGGRRPTRYRTNMTLDQIKGRYGTQKIRDREERVAIEA